MKKFSYVCEIVGCLDEFWKKLLGLMEDVFGGFLNCWLKFVEVLKWFSFGCKELSKGLSSEPFE